jgi:hypothetical protein
MGRLFEKKVEEKPVETPKAEEKKEVAEPEQVLVTENMLINAKLDRILALLEEAMKEQQQ